MKSKRRFIPLVFLGAIIMSLLLIVPVFSADGAVRFYDTSDTDDDQEWARQGGSVYLEVKDSDLDVAMKVSGEVQNVPEDRSWFRVNNTPIVDDSGDTFINDRDVHVVARNLDGSAGSTLAVDRVSVDGRVDLVDTTFSGAVLVTYKGAVVNNTGDTVTVRSRQEPNGIKVQLSEDENKPQSGVFRLTIETTSGDSDADASPPKLKVAKSDTITLRYSEADPKGTRTETLRVETTAPSFSDITPANGSAGRADPDVGFRVTDGVSGIDDDDDVYVVYVVVDENGNVVGGVGEESGGADPVTGGFQARERISTTLDDATVYWWGKAVDRAGNWGVSDRKAKIKDANDDEVSDSCNAQDFVDNQDSLANVDFSGADIDVTASMFGCQPYKVKIDDTKPEMLGGVDGTRTGAFWDTDKDGDDKTNEEPAKAKANMVLVKFSEALDAETVSAADFEVDDNTPSKAEVFDGAKSNVFLTLSSDLNPHAKPKVEVVGTVEDLAGNRLTSDKVDEAVDGIAPTLTVTLEGGDRPVTKGSVKVTVTANEDVGTPSVVARQVMHTDDDSDDALGPVSGGDEEEAILKEGETNVYEATLSVSSPGLYNVYVTATDANNSANVGSKGVSAGPIDVSDDTKAVLFEFDNAVPDPMVTPEKSDNSDPFITINYASEGKEYPAKDSDNKDVDVDSYGAVTIVSATLKSPDMDAMDIAGSLATTDNVKFLYKASDLAKGDHKVKVKAKDAAGNEAEFEGTVKIEERQPFELKLKPGWNLVSLPGSPTNASLNAVIPADHPASTILSYDAEAGWMTAIRSEDGTWLGTLTTVDASRAYWIQTDTFDSIKVDIPRIGAGTSVPPTISLMAGWNFVPVVDVTGNKPHGDTTDAKTYFSGTKVNRVYTFDTEMGMWQVVALDGTGDLMVGSGYWAHSTEDGVLAP